MQGYKSVDFLDQPPLKVSILHRESDPRYVARIRESWEKSKSHSEPLGIREFDDVIVEFSDTTRCLYDRDGRRIGSTLQLRYEVAEDHKWFAAESLEDNNVAFTIEQPVIFQSPIQHHWGHFITETLSRSWAARELHDLIDGASFFHNGRLARLEGTMQPVLFELLCLGGFRQMAIDPAASRVRFAKCFVPTQSFALGDSGHADPRHLETPRRIAERLLASRSRDGRPVYFSRSRIADAKSRRWIGNEIELEVLLEALGVLVVHMQELTLAEQIAILNTHNVFIGPIGSALHDIMFCLPDHHVTTFVLTAFRVGTEYLLVNEIVGNDAHYLEVMSVVESQGVARQLTIDIEATVAYLRSHGVV